MAHSNSMKWINPINWLTCYMNDIYIYKNCLMSLNTIWCFMPWNTNTGSLLCVMTILSYNERSFTRKDGIHVEKGKDSPHNWRRKTLTQPPYRLWYPIMGIPSPGKKVFILKQAQIPATLVEGKQIPTSKPIIQTPPTDNISAPRVTFVVWPYIDSRRSGPIGVCAGQFLKN